jgi:DNA polymerase III sliding clamp (beta) subunit (PCNA family)
MKLSKEVLNLVHTASKDVVRYHLNGICIDFQSGYAVATDGHALARMPLYDVPKEYKKRKQAIIDRAAAEYMLKLKGTDFDLMEVDFSDTEISIKYPGREAKFLLIDGKYPEYEAVIPRNDRQEVVFSFDPELLMRLAKAMSQGKRNKGITIAFADGDPLKPARVFNGTENCLGVLMPMRLSGVPVWGKPEQKDEKESA